MNKALLAGVLLLFPVTTCVFVVGVVHRDLCEGDHNCEGPARAVGEAVAEYDREYGELPTSLSDIVPRYLRTQPKDRDGQLLYFAWAEGASGPVVIWRPRAFRRCSLNPTNDDVTCYWI